jgi:hypothetical protein
MPEGISAPAGLIAVMVPAGPITERQWWEALADRVSELAVEAGQQAAQEACDLLNLASPEEPQETGQFLILGNLNLLTHLDLATDKSPWPAVAAPSKQAAEAIAETDLATWADLASSMVSESSLD